MTPSDRQVLRDAALAALNGTAHRTAQAFDWELQTSNSFRRIGTRSYGDGDVLCATKHPYDGQPDLLAAPGVLAYLIAAQPRVVLELLDYIDVIEKFIVRIDEIEQHLKALRTHVETVLKEITR